VYGASRFEQKTIDAPSSVTIVTSDEVKKYGYRTLGDVLASAQGFYLSYDRNYAFLGARGINLGDFNDRILLLVDGHRVNNNFNDGAAIGTDFILDPDLIDRVEVIRGPGSAIYGNNAFFGVINVITRQGKQLNGFEVSGDYGSFDAYHARASYGKLFDNGFQMLLSGTYYDSAGQERLFYKEFNTPAQNHGIAQDMDGDKFGSGFGSLSYGDLTLEGAFNRREKVNPTAQFNLTTFNDPRLRTIDERGYSELKFAHSFPDVVDVTAQVYYDSYSHKIGFPQSLLAGTNVVFSSFSSEKDLGEWWGAELQLNKRLWDRHDLTLGAEYRDDFLQDSRVIVENSPGAGSHNRANRQTYGLYAQGDFVVLTNLHLTGGVRYDQYSDFSPSLNPRLALIYHPYTTSTLKAIYGTAFRAPSFYEITTSDHALQPEDITGYELVYEQEIGPHLRSSLSGFYNQMDDLLVFSSGTFTNFNADTKGLELALEGNWAGGIRSRASYSFQDTRTSSVGWDMPDSPNHLVKLNVSVPLVRDKVFAGLEFDYTSNRRSLHNTTDPFGQPLTVQGEQAGGFGVINLTLFTQKLIKNLEFSASVYNLLDRHYVDPASQFHVQDVIEQDGRTFRVKLTYRF
jgi:iron complex outermembrane receptor protein